MIVVHMPFLFYNTIFKGEMNKMPTAKIDEYTQILDFLKENEDKLKILLSVDEKMKNYRFRINGKKSSRTIFMSDKLQFIMNEFCIENELKIGEFVEFAVVEHLNRNGYSSKLSEIISNLTPSLEGETGGKA